MALWFRSRVIVVLNTGLFLILLFTYLSTSPKYWPNISFALVALITARTLNWKKQLLMIKTELLRNTNFYNGIFYGPLCLISPGSRPICDSAPGRLPQYYILY